MCFITTIEFCRCCANYLENTHTNVDICHNKDCKQLASVYVNKAFCVSCLDRHCDSEKCYACIIKNAFIFK